MERCWQGTIWMYSHIAWIMLQCRYIHRITCITFHAIHRIHASHCMLDLHYMHFLQCIAYISWHALHCKHHITWVMMCVTLRTMHHKHYVHYIACYITRWERGGECQPGGSSADPTPWMPWSSAERRRWRSAEGNARQYPYVTPNRSCQRPQLCRIHQGRHRVRRWRQRKLSASEVNMSELWFGTAVALPLLSA